MTFRVSARVSLCGFSVVFTQVRRVLRPVRSLGVVLGVEPACTAGVTTVFSGMG